VASIHRGSTHGDISSTRLILNLPPKWSRFASRCLRRHQRRRGRRAAPERSRPIFFSYCIIRAVRISRIAGSPANGASNRRRSRISHWALGRTADGGRQREIDRQDDHRDQDACKDQIVDHLASEMLPSILRHKLAAAFDIEYLQPADCRLQPDKFNLSGFNKYSQGLHRNRTGCPNALSGCARMRLSLILWLSLMEESQRTEEFGGCP
jgi:hypothetical protein